MELMFTTSCISLRREITDDLSPTYDTILGSIYIGVYLHTQKVRLKPWASMSNAQHNIDIFGIMDLTRGKRWLHGWLQKPRAHMHSLLMSEYDEDTFHCLYGSGVLVEPCFVYRHGNTSCPYEAAHSKLLC